MQQNSKKVLEMLAEGKISAEEAGRLLDRLNGVEQPGTDALSETVEEATSRAAFEREAPEEPKFLRVVVNSQNGDKVNVRVPMALIRAGIKLKALLPEHAKEKMEGHGVDLSALSELDTDELIQALAALTVDVESQNGDQVRVFCE